MTTIFAKATDQVLVATQLPKVACNNQNTVKLHVDFDSAWDGYAKSAVFYTSKDPTVYEIILSSDGNCIVPAEVLIEEATLYITVRGVKTANKEVKSSTPVKYRVLEGTPSVVISDPAPNVYQQLLSALGETGRALAVERARIDTAIATKDVYINGYTELTDMRVGNDGTIYKTAGEAMRSQIGRVDAEHLKLTGQEKITFTKGSNIKLAYEIGETVDITPEAISFYYYAIVPASAGDKFTLTASGGDNPRTWGFLSESNILLDVAPEHNMRRRRSDRA